MHYFLKAPFIYYVMVDYNLRHGVNKCSLSLRQCFLFSDQKSRREFSDHLAQAHYFTDEEL